MQRLQNRQNTRHRHNTPNFKSPTSIIGEELATRETMGILTAWKAYWKIQRQQKNLEKRLEKGTTKGDAYENEKKMYNEMMTEIERTIHHQMGELQHYQEVNQKYNTYEEREECTQNGRNN